MFELISQTVCRNSTSQYFLLTPKVPTIQLNWNPSLGRSELNASAGMCALGSHRSAFTSALCIAAAARPGVRGSHDDLVHLQRPVDDEAQALGRGPLPAEAPRAQGLGRACVTRHVRAPPR